MRPAVQAHGGRRDDVAGTLLLAPAVLLVVAFAVLPLLASLTEAFRRDGYAVKEIPGSAADLELHKNGRVSIVCCKRWKVAQTGAGPLRELYAAKQARDAQECIYVAAGDFTANARAYATEKGIRLVHDAALATLIARVGRGRWRWSFFR